MAAYGSTGGALAERTSVKDEPEGCMELSSPYVAEFVGTFLIVFTMGCCSICGDPMWNPTGMAFAVVVAVYSFGPVSGAHLNPAISLALAFVGKFPWVKMFGYMFAQVAGGLMGSLCYWAIFQQAVALGPPVKVQYLTTDFQWYDIGCVEAVYTFMLCFVYMNCVASDRNNKEGDENHFFALATGFVYIAGGYPSLNVSGSIFNPAASLALGLTSQKFFWMLIYIAAQVAGAWLASLLFAVVRPEDFKMQYDGRLEDFEVPIRAKLMSELIGTFMVVLTVGLNLVMISPAGPWSSAAAYICLIYSLGDVSGGHFNPAVTLAVMLSRRGICGIVLGQSYILHQVLAGATAGIVFSHFEAVGPREGGKEDIAYPLGPHGSHGWPEVAMAEVLFSMVFAFAFLAIATSTMPPSTTKTNFYFGFAIGSCITIGGFAIGPLSGGAPLNPAVAVGRGVSEVISIASLHHAKLNLHRLMHCVWFAGCEFIGGALAAVVFSLTHQKEYLKDGSNYPHIP